MGPPRAPSEARTREHHARANTLDAFLAEFAPQSMHADDTSFGFWLDFFVFERRRIEAIKLNKYHQTAPGPA